MERIKKILGFLDDELGMDPGVSLALFFFIVVALGLAVVNGGRLDLLELLRIITLLSPIWLPIALLAIFLRKWREYVQTKQKTNTDFTLFEIKLPEEITRTPLAMETVVNVMYHTGTPQDWYDGLIKGITRPQFSLEIASLEGDVRFFIRTPTKLKEMLKAQIYSQYPTVEVHEVEDYAEKIQYDEKTMELFALEQKLAKADPYPIKTYVDWGLDREGLKEEEKVDPINSILEFMGSIGKGEYLFMQIIVRSHIPDKVWGEKRRPEWQETAQKEVDEIIAKLRNEGSEGGWVTYRPPTEGEKEVMEALNRNVRKKPFDTGIRTVYFGYRDGGYSSDRHNAIPTMFRTFQSHTLNNIKPVFRTSFNWWFSNPFGIRKRMRQREAFQAYRWRSYFLPPYERSYFVLSSEELATIYHFPGRVTTTPTLRREPSRKAEAPPNLPR